MASGVTKIADIIVPSVFDPYVQKMTAELTAIIQSGVMVEDDGLNANLAGGGITFNSPSFNDLDNDADNVSTDNDASDSTPNKIGTHQEIQVRLSRNNSWSNMDLATVLAGADPMEAIANRVAAYWARRLQQAFIATNVGVFADNDANDSGDYTNDVSGGGYVAGVTDFSAEAFIDTLATAGDADSGLGMVLVHSVVYNRMRKNNLIDFIPDARGEVNIPTFLGRRVVIDDGMPNPSAAAPANTAAGIYHTWIFGPGAYRFGNGTPEVPSEMDRKPAAGDGGGQDVLHSRVEWCIHPAGHAYTGTAPNGGPDNTANANMLAAAASWNRVWPERKQVKIARLITRES
jgi:hypothetical protein